MTDEASKKDEAQAKRASPRVRAGVAFGIGSAAIVAALLYANRKGRSDRGGKS